MVKEEQQWIQDVLMKLQRKMKVVAGRTSNKIPYTTVDGRYDDWTDKNICWWTNGFWGGIMWQMYHLTGDELYRTVALTVENKLDANLLNHQGMDHDSGFKWLTTSGANYRMTGDQSAYNRTLLAADNLAGRINLAGGFIRAWNDEDEGSKAGWAIIDCMMNLPLLYWASERTKDPRYSQIAELHANTVLKHFIRSDGSVHHIVEFDSHTGKMIRAYGGQGMEAGSSWTRGQAWAIYGFVLSFIHTKERRYLDASCRIADYFINHVREDGAVAVDFKQPVDCTWEDSSAAAIAASGMLELARQLGEKGTAYRDNAVRLLRFLLENRCDWNAETDHIVEKCTAAYHDEKHEFAIIYGDYFLIEALLKLADKELFIW